MKTARLLILALLPALLTLVASIAAGCGSGENYGDLYSCQYPIEHYDSHGRYDPCCDFEPCDAPVDAGQDGDAGEAQEFCPADQCIPSSPQDPWSVKPKLLWQGTLGEEPDCPGELPIRGQWWGDLTYPPLSCPLCECAPPAGGTCGLPATITAHTAMCYQPAPDIPFDPLTTWDGSCNADNPIASTAGVQPLTVDSLAVEEEIPCEPSAVAIPITDVQPSWGISAVTCAKDVSNFLPCEEENGKTCTPMAAPPEGFEICISREGEHACPATYPTRYTFYEEMEDGRGCSACECGSPEGGVCTATISVYQDDACSVPLPLVLGIDSSKAYCVDIPPDVPLRSKQITPPVYHPGTCPPMGGEPTGEVIPTEPITFCCLPPARPPL